MTPAGSQANSKIDLGLIGCGGRGTWIADLFKKHGGYNVVALADYFPDRVEAGVPALELVRRGALTFEAPDRERFPSLDLAHGALAAGGGAVRAGGRDPQARSGPVRRPARAGG